MTHHHTAQGLASLGRHGDTMLVHMSPHEVAGLNYLAKKQGTKLTINPETGLPEAFSLGGFFSSLLPTFVGMAFPGGGMMPLLAGALTGAGVAAAKKENPLLGGLMGGLGGYSGSQLGTALSAASTPTAATTLPANTFGGLTQSADLATKAVEDAAIQSGMKGAANLPMDAGQKAILDNIAATRSASTIPQIGMANTFGQTASAATLPQSTGSSIFGGFKNIATGQPGAWDAFKAAGGSGMKLAMPVGGALLGGLEPTDIYGEPLKPKEDKYDPYATLNLSNDTGLRLLAGGGSITSNAQAGTGLSGLYSNQDMQPTANISQDGYGIGRLDSLAAEGSKAKAADMFYAMGGPVSFADGGDTTKDETQMTDMDTTGIASLTPVTPSQPSIPAQAIANQVMPAEPSGSIIEQVTTKLQQDPNYQPTNPIEAAIVRQIKGDGQEGQSQGITGLGAGPSEPMAPSYTASQPIGPTYYAGMNAPRGFAEGGNTNLNLDRLPTLNVNTGKTSYAPSQVGLGALLSRLFESRNIPMSPGLAKLFGINQTVPTVTPTAAPVGPTGPGYTEPLYPTGPDFAATVPTPQGTYGVALPSMARGGYLDGAGDGMSDSIPATIEGKQPARLADGEFVVPADVVSHIGNGSSKAGSQRLYSMLDRVRKARTGTKKQGKQIKPEKYMPA